MIPNHFISLINDTVNRITNLIKRCVLTKTTKDNTQYQIVQCQYLGHIADIESASLYGLSSNPPLDSTGIMFNLQANEENRAAFFNLPQKRFKDLKPWEVQVGNYLTRSSVKFSEDKSITINSLGEIIVTSADNLTITTTGDIEITASGNLNIKGNNVTTVEAATTLILKAPQIIFEGNATISGSMNVTGTLLVDGIDIRNHIHGGVRSGTSTTGIPIN